MLQTGHGVQSDSLTGAGADAAPSMSCLCLAELQPNQRLNLLPCLHSTPTHQPARHQLAFPTTPPLPVRPCPSLSPLLLSLPSSPHTSPAAVLQGRHTMMQCCHAGYMMTAPSHHIVQVSACNEQARVQGGERQREEKLQRVRARACAPLAPPPAPSLAQADRAGSGLACASACWLTCSV